MIFIKGLERHWKKLSSHSEDSEDCCLHQINKCRQLVTKHDDLDEDEIITNKARGWSTEGREQQCSRYNRATGQTDLYLHSKNSFWVKTTKEKKENLCAKVSVLSLSLIYIYVLPRDKQRRQSDVRWRWTPLPVFCQIWKLEDLLSPYMDRLGGTIANQNRNGPGLDVGRKPLSLEEMQLVVMTKMQNRRADKGFKLWINCEGSVWSFKGLSLHLT